MRAFIVSLGADTGGQGARLKIALDRYSTVKATAMCSRENYLRFPQDVRWNDDEAQRLYDVADVVHLRNSMAAYERFDHGQHKPVVVHHHGSRLRDSGGAVQAECTGAVNIVSTVDLLKCMPGATWLPSPYDLDAMRTKYGRERRGKLRIGHAPTNRAAKGTDTILAAIAELHKSYDFDFDLIEQVQWSVCLSRKGMCDIFIDQLTYGYGGNGVEAMAMGVALVSGWNDPAEREVFVAETSQEPPFAEASAEDLTAVLARLIEDRAHREEIATQGEQFVQAFHSEQAVAERLVEVYRSTIRQQVQMIDDEVAL